MRKYIALSLSALIISFHIIAQSCVPFKLDITGSALYWPNRSGSFVNPKGWGSYGNQPGQGHSGADFYAMDWQNILVPSCDSAFLSPMTGKVVYIFADCPNHCAGGNGCGGYANQVIIQSDLDTNFYFRAAHFSNVNVYPGKYVVPGDLIGVIGSTGSSSGPHTHAALYYSKTKDISTLISLTGTDIFAVPFVFSATCPLTVVTSVSNILQAEDIKIFPNPVYNQLFLTNSQSSPAKTKWQLFDNNGRKLREGVFTVSEMIDMRRFQPQIYFIKLTSTRFDVTVKIIKL